MDKDKTKLHPDNLMARQKRIKRIKTAIIVIVLIFLILPTILCVILFLKLNSLQKQVDILMVAHYDATYSELYNKSGEIVAHAAVTDNIDESNQEDYREDLLQKEEKDSLKSHDSEDIAEIGDNKSKADNKEQKYLGKKIYLTFDDGPSSYTDDILDILAEYNVKATFFVVGKTDEYSKEMYKRIVEEGHTLGMHSYSHSYKYIYNSLEDFDKDFTKLRDLLYDTTGYMPNIYRFPGGSGNNVSEVEISALIHYLNEKSVTYFDWNVINGDATGEDLSQNALYNNVINGIEMRSTSIVLMHDTNVKEKTVKSLKRILKTLTEEGGTLLPLDENVTPIQHVKSSSFEQ